MPGTHISRITDIDVDSITRELFPDDATPAPEVPVAPSEAAPSQPTTPAVSVAVPSPLASVSSDCSPVPPSTVVPTPLAQYLGLIGPNLLQATVSPPAWLVMPQYGHPLMLGDGPIDLVVSPIPVAIPTPETSLPELPGNNPAPSFDGCGGY
jgi:hypothetical protein